MLIEWLCWNLLWYLALKSFRKNCFLTTRNSCSQLKTPVVYTNLIQLNGLRTFPFFALHPAELEPDFEMRGPKKAGKGEIYGCFWVKRRFFRDSCLTGLILKLIFFFEKIYFKGLNRQQDTCLHIRNRLLRLGPHCGTLTTIQAQALNNLKN